MSELYAILTLYLGFPPNYVMDEMQMYEVSALMKYSFYRHKESWEQARLTAFMTAQCNSSKKLKIQDIVKFDWEKDADVKDTYISKEDIENLSRQAEEYEKMFASQI